MTGASATGDGPRPIRVEGLWKKYRKGRSHDSLRDLIPATVARLVRGRPDPADELRGREFWALRDVSFSVEPGRVMGIVGPNGSGKSTLLKLLTGIMHPTRGRIDVHGRVGALIELAAGFHGELSGAENVYLQGSVMGIARSEIERRFDEIVDFSGVADFIDTPVKRYSSGMLARLGFSIAAHMDPDVLLIDEVLSVGDRAFQRKAEARLREIVARDIPVVVVSHRLESITTICDRAILMSRGEIVAEGSPTEVIARYVDGDHLADEARGAAPIELEQMRVEPTGPYPPGSVVRVSLAAESVREPGPGTVLGFRVWRLPDEVIVFATHSAACAVTLPPTGRFAIDLELSLNLGAGLYRIQPCVWDVSPYHEWTRGDSVLVEVAEDRSVIGSVSLAPKMRLTGA